MVLLGGIWIARTQQPVHGDLKLNKIRDNLYEISPVPEVSGAGGNVTVVVTRDGVILVDDKYDWDHDGILAKVKTVTDKPVRYVINTHQHGDHTGGNAKMLPMGVQLLISKQARENMVQLKMPGLPQISFENNLQVSLGDDTAEAFHFGRSHTNGDSVVLFRAQRVLSTGDMCVRGDEFPPLIDYSAGGSIMEWTQDPGYRPQAGLRHSHSRTWPGRHQTRSGGFSKLAGENSQPGSRDECGQQEQR